MNLVDFFHKTYYPDLSVDQVAAAFSKPEVVDIAYNHVQKKYYPDLPPEKVKGFFSNFFNKQTRPEESVNTIQPIGFKPLEIKSLNVEPPTPERIFGDIKPQSQTQTLRQQPKFNNIVEKQKYYDSLVGKYGKGVQGRQNYIDLYNQQLNIPETSFPAFDLDTPQHLLPEKYKNLEKSELKDYLFEINTYGAEQPRIKGFPAKKDTWRDIIDRNKNIENKALLFASLMDEGGDKVSNHKAVWDGDVIQEYDGYRHFGLDTAGNKIDEFVKKGLLDKSILDKNRTRPRIEQNEKGEQITTLSFSNLDDVVSVKNAFMQNERKNILDYADGEKIFLSPQAADYFTIAALNYGPNGAKKMIKRYHDKGLTYDDEFMNSPQKEYSQIDKNIKRRLAAAKMLTEEGVINNVR